MLRQYFQIKEQHPDAILFFRMGDFYEMFFEDAKIAAPILEIVLTSRDKKKDDAIPLCGIPYHARDFYAAKLLRSGHKIAICEQVEDPALCKGLVKREVTHILTPGTALELDADVGEQANYVTALFGDGQQLAMASIDLAQSHLEVRSFSQANGLEELRNELYKKAPKELLYKNSHHQIICDILQSLPDISMPLLNQSEGSDSHLSESESLIKRQFAIQDLAAFGLIGYPAAIHATAMLLRYMHGIRKNELKHIHTLNFTAQADHLIMDAASFRNLDILNNSKSGSAKGSLFQAVDQTVTSMGKRLLRTWLSYPSLDKAVIENRQDSLEAFTGNLIIRSETRKILKTLTDTGKIAAKLSLNIILPLQLIQLKKTLQSLPQLKECLKLLPSTLIQSLQNELDPLPSTTALIDAALSEESTGQLGSGTVFKKGYNRDLDELRTITFDAKTVIAALEQEERKKTGISSLKIRYNRVFGYFIDITNTHLALVPDTYIRKQTLVNSERFITDTLKELEEKILKAEEKLLSLEREQFSQLVAQILPFCSHLQKNADIIAELDVLSAGAELASGRGFNRPIIRTDRAIKIEAGRHPVIELNVQGGFIPNDLILTSDEQQILLITGPNMGGKSTYLRQTALIVILAQIGYFVPAQKSSIAICDRIFTRIGASDSLIEGKSTFMIEMIETASILNNATDRSLILLDEVGRGTSTFDGLSIAWAVVEYLHQHKNRPKTLFATHYHELTELAQIFDRIRNFHIAVREWQDKVVFLHKILPGATDQSFGIHVAKIAGLPNPVIERAKEILLNLEKKELNRLVTERITGQLPKMPQTQASLFPQEAELKVWDEIKSRLAEINISQLTPLEALNILHYLQHKGQEIEKGK